MEPPPHPKPKEDFKEPFLKQPGLQRSRRVELLGICYPTGAPAKEGSQMRLSGPGLLRGIGLVVEPQYFGLKLAERVY